MNDVKKAGTNGGEDISPDRCPTEQQIGPGRHRTTAKGGRRRKQSQEVNGIVMECYYRSNPEAVGYRDSAYDLERKKNVWCKRTTIVRSEVQDCYKKMVFRFGIEWD